MILIGLYVMSGKIRVWRTGAGTFFLISILLGILILITTRLLYLQTVGEHSGGWLLQHQGYNTRGTTPVVQHQGCTVV